MQIDTTDLSYKMHTSLRKYCDNTQTSIMWNLLHIVSKENFIIFFKAVDFAINGIEFETKNDVVKKIKDAWLNVDYVGDYERSVLHCTAELFNKDSWQGFCMLLF